MALILCLLAFLVCYGVGRRSLVTGLVALLGVGYLYGIMRANLPETYSHFIFDAGVLGLYGAQLFRRLTAHEEYRVGLLRPWLEFLVVWPLLLFLIPIQDYAIQFVGLRGSVFLLPFVLFGARLEAADRYRLALWLSGLNIFAFLVGVSEYWLGLESFFPHNHVTELIYLSKDLVGHTAYRIPSAFANAHAYGGTMVMGLPLLIGAFMQKRKSNWHSYLLVVGITTALVGLLMSAARTHFLVAAALIIVFIFSLRSKLGYALGWLILLCGIGWLVSGEERLQRFMELKNTDSVVERVSWSVNMSFFEIAARYPFGNGLGGGGTSIPYFLQDRIVDPVTMENEYARIMLEQGVMGLVLWVLFILWVMARGRERSALDSWYLGKRLAWVSCGLYFATGLTGTGLLTSIPQSCLFLLLVGWLGARPSRSELTATAAAQNARHEIQAPAQLYN